MRSETHPDRVSELVLYGVYTLTKGELSWFYQFGVSEIFPDKWELFQEPIPEAERSDMISAYRKRLTSEDRAIQIEAAKAWSKWEAETITLLPNNTFSSSFVDEHFALAFARLENHYFQTVSRLYTVPSALLTQIGRAMPFLAPDLTCCLCALATARRS